MLNNQKQNLVLIQDLGRIYLNDNSKQKKRYGLFKCFCGNEFKARFDSIKDGNTKSCGCLNIKVSKEKFLTHNLSKHRLYGTWTQMLDRCNNENNINYKEYGKKGIKVCNKWLNIKNFIDDMYPSFIEGLTIDRIDNDKGYYMENCRWATKETQARNKRLLMSTNTSGYKGVSWNKNNKKFQSYITIHNKKISLGYYKNSIDGARAYDNYVITNNLDFKLNFK
jgi:hypothetical protein